VNESQPSRLRHFSHWLRRIGSAGTRGPGRESVELDAALGTRGPVQESEEEKGGKLRDRELVESGGGRVRLYTWRMAGLADEGGSDAIPDAAGAVRVVTGR
jgi:hypothetical protein